MLSGANELFTHRADPFTLEHGWKSLAFVPYFVYEIYFALAEVYLEPNQMSKMEIFEKYVTPDWPGID